MPPPAQTYKTPVVLEEQNPQYRYKMDFVNITAASTLTLTVYERPSILAKAVGKIPLMKRVRDGTASRGHGPGRCHTVLSSTAVLVHLKKYPKHPKLLEPSSTHRRQRQSSLATFGHGWLTLQRRAKSAISGRYRKPR